MMHLFNLLIIKEIRARQIHARTGSVLHKAAATSFVSVHPVTLDNDAKTKIRACQIHARMAVSVYLAVAEVSEAHLVVDMETVDRRAVEDMETVDHRDRMAALTVDLFHTAAL